MIGVQISHRDHGVTSKPSHPGVIRTVVEQEVTDAARVRMGLRSIVGRMTVEKVVVVMIIASPNDLLDTSKFTFISCSVCHQSSKSREKVGSRSGLYVKRISFNTPNPPLQKQMADEYGEYT